MSLNIQHLHRVPRKHKHKPSYHLSFHTFSYSLHLTYYVTLIRCCFLSLYPYLNSGTDWEADWLRPVTSESIELTVLDVLWDSNMQDTNLDCTSILFLNPKINRNPVSKSHKTTILKSIHRSSRDTSITHADCHAWYCWTNLQMWNFVIKFCRLIWAMDEKFGFKTWLYLLSE